jgi:hypothetical protein
VFAETKDAFIGGAEVRFDAGVVEVFESFAGSADQRQLASGEFGGSERRKFQAPKIEVGIDEREAIGVDAVGGAHFADDADGGFAVAVGATKDELLAPWRLRRTLLVGSEKTLPSRSLPIRRIGTSLGMRPVIRTTCSGK